MAIIDWPTNRAFRGATFSLGLDTSESAYTAFHTGNRQRFSQGADRLRGALLLPPTISPLEGALREAFMLSWKSSGDHVRMGMPHRTLPAGSLRGSPVVKTTALAGARSVQFSNATGGNLLLGGSFEFDTDSNGRADNWAAVSIGSVSSVVYSRESGTPDDGRYEQGISANYGATGSSHEAGVERNVTGLAPGPYTVLANVRGDVNQSARIAVEWRDSGGAVISGVTVATVAVTGAAQRFGATATAPANTTQCTVRLLTSASVSTGTRVVRWDSCAVKPGTTDLSWPGAATLLAGDWLASGGNLLLVGPAGAQALDSGDMTVSLALPLAKTLTAGATVQWSAPTGLWELDDDGLQLDYSAPVLQGGVAIALRQVIA